MTRIFNVVLVASAALATLGLVASFAPLVDTEWWAVRLLDFPRLQIAIALLVFAVPVAFGSRRAPLSAGCLLLGIASGLGLHAYTLWPYRPGGQSFVTDCPADRRVSVMVANVLLGNRQSDGLLASVRREKPDLFLAMETDGWWERELSVLKDEMPHEIEKITGSYYGLQLYSRLPLTDPQIRFLAGRDTPSVLTGVTLRTGESIAFLGLHPRPPEVWHSALGRDAELYQAALDLREGDRPAIVAGDLNATPWEEAVARARRIAHLIDPRRGYGYVPTFSAKSVIGSWPLDHVFHNGGFATTEIKRLPAFGSDHYPYLVRLCRTPGAVGERPPGEEPGDIAKARRIIAAARNGQ